MIRRPPRSTQGVSSAASDVYKRQIPGIYAPKWVELSVSSDGEEWTVVDRIESTLDPTDRKLRFETFTFYPRTTCRYLRIQYEEAQRGRFLFADELIVW